MSRIRLLAPLGTALLATALVACDKRPKPAPKADPTPESAKPDKGQADPKDAEHGEKPEANGQAHGDKAKPKASEKPASIPFKPPFDQTPELTAKYKSGLEYEDFVFGEGTPAQPGSRLSIHYTGYLEDGTIFDSSVEKKRPPFSFQLGQGRVIKGWDIGIAGMKKGGKRKLKIPSELAYGSMSRGKIPANAPLVFTLEMIDVRPPLPKPKDESAFKTRPVAKKRLPGGLRVTDYALGDGEPAQKGDTVYVHYTGKLKDGTVFDSSVSRSQPFSFPLGGGRVIKGWDQGLEGMKVGGLRHLKIPPNLGYGDRDMGKIPPKSTLEFTVEMMDIVKPPKPAEEPKADAAKDDASEKDKDKDKDKKDAKDPKAEPASDKPH